MQYIPGNTVIQIKNKQDGTVIYSLQQSCLFFLFLGDDALKDNEIIKTDGIINLVYKKTNFANDYDIILNRTNETIGNIWFDKGEDEKYIYLYGNVGYQIEEEYQNKGFATRSLQLMKEILKEQKIKEMILAIESDNEYSIKTATAVGASLSETRYEKKEDKIEKKLIYKYKIGG